MLHKAGFYLEATGLALGLVLIALILLGLLGLLDVPHFPFKINS
jgi:hypothetical protein